MRIFPRLRIFRICFLMERGNIDDRSSERRAGPLAGAVDGDLAQWIVAAESPLAAQAGRRYWSAAEMRWMRRSRRTP